MPGKSGMPTTDRSGLPVGSESSARMPTSIDSLSILLQRHARNPPSLVCSLDLM